MAARPPGRIPPESWFVGCGAMGGAMVAGWHRARVDLSGLTAIRPSGTLVPHVTTVTDLPEGEPSWCFLGFKPQKLAEIAPNLESHIGERTVLLSILAGAEAATLRNLFPRARATVRLMPNLPVSEGQGVTALYSDDANPVLRDEVELLLGELGIAPWCADENEFDVVGALAGSGPAYVARFVDALAAEGAAQGLAPALADRLALQVVAGTGLMVRATGESMNALATRVASPGGTTEAGLRVLDASDGLRPLMARVIAAWRERSNEMARTARGD